MRLYLPFNSRSKHTHDPHWPGSPASQGLRTWKFDGGADSKQSVSRLITCCFWEVQKNLKSGQSWGFKVLFFFCRPMKKESIAKMASGGYQRCWKTRHLLRANHGDLMSVTVVMAQAKSPWCPKLVRKRKVNKALSTWKQGIWIWEKLMRPCK